MKKLSLWHRQTGIYPHLYQSSLQHGKVPTKHAPICSVFKSTYKRPQRHTHRYNDWTAETKNKGSSLRGRHYHLPYLPRRIPKLKEAITIYEQASGSKINKHNSQVLALGTWDKNRSVLNIPYQEQITTLGLIIRKQCNIPAKHVG
jgi:hypothetical protein